MLPLILTAIDLCSLRHVTYVPPCGKCESVLLQADPLCLCVDVFSQVSDSNGVLVLSKFDSFLREALKLPTAVHEGPSFGYAHTLARSCFPQQVRSPAFIRLSLITVDFFHRGVPGSARWKIMLCSGL